jgi:hypothetical protein
MADRGAFTLATAARSVPGDSDEAPDDQPEQLAFPSGIAAATTLRSLYSRGNEARKAYALVAACRWRSSVLNTAEDQFIALGKFFTWMKVNLFDVHLPDLVPADASVCLPASRWSLIRTERAPDAEWIVDFAVAVHAGASAVLYFSPPWLQSLDALNVGVPGYVPSIPLAAGGTLFHPVRWALWGGASVLVFTSLASLALQWRTVGRSFAVLRRTSSGAGTELDAKMAAIEVPNA